MKVWIVCRPCPREVAGHATGIVFADNEKARTYILEAKKKLPPADTVEYWDEENEPPYLMEGELQ